MQLTFGRKKFHLEVKVNGVPRSVYFAWIAEKIISDRQLFHRTIVQPKFVFGQTNVIYL